MLVFKVEIPRYCMIEINLKNLKAKKISKNNYTLQRVGKPVVDLKKNKRFEGIEQQKKEGLIKK